MPMLEAIEQRATAQGVPVDARIERGRSYRHALDRLLEEESFDRVVVPASADGGEGLSGEDLVWLLRKAPAEVLILRPAAQADGQRRLKAAAVREAHAQGSSGLEHRPAGGAADRGLVGEAVDQARMAAQGDLDAGLAHPQRVGLALVAQRVEAGGGDVGGRQAGEVAAPAGSRPAGRRGRPGRGSGPRTSPCRPW